MNFFSIRACRVPKKLVHKLHMLFPYLMMSHPKSMAAHSKGRHLTAAGITSLAISAMAGAMMLSGGEARAICSPSGLEGNMNPPGALATCNIIDPTLGSQHTQASIVSSNLPAGTNVNYELTGLFYPLSQAEIDTDFNDPFNGGLVNGNLVYAFYKVDGLNGTLINGVDMAGSCLENCLVTKEVFSDVGMTNKVIPDLVFTGTFIPTQNLPPAPTYYFKDTFTTNGGAIDNMQNTVRTPGPLPILGAGAAFGFSRKLRGRIKAARNA